MRRTFRDNVGSQRRVPKFDGLGAEGRCWKDHVCDEFHAQLPLISDVTGPCIDLEPTAHLPGRVLCRNGGLDFSQHAQWYLWVDGLHRIRSVVKSMVLLCL